MEGPEAALRFLFQIRQEAPLRREVEALGVDATLAGLMGVGALYGYSFTGEELKAAIRHDWTMRWHRYASTQRPAGSAEPVPE